MSGEITLKMVFFKPKKGKFIANTNTKIANVLFEIHTDIKDNKVQFNIWKNGGVELNRLHVNVIRDRNELINRMIAEVKKS